MKLSVLFFLATTILHGKVIYFTPIPNMAIEEIFYNPNSGRDEVNKPFFALREHLENLGHTVKYWGSGNIKEADIVISLVQISSHLLRDISSLPKNHCFLLIFEPPVTYPAIYEKSLEDHFGKIFTMFDDQVDDQKYFKLFYPQPRLKMIDNIPDFSEKKLCTIITRNNSFGHPQCIYGERRKVIQFFEDLHSYELDIYGSGWDGHENYKGTIPHKWPVLKNYKFAFCYENMGRQNGYITEKIFDSFVGGCIPIYLGADNITDYVPKECFIDRRNFSSEKELYRFLKQMNRETYEGYMQAIRDYLDSPLSWLFSIENFIDTLVRQLDDE